MYCTGTQIKNKLLVLYKTVFYFVFIVYKCNEKRTIDKKYWTATLENAPTSYLFDRWGPRTFEGQSLSKKQRRHIGLVHIDIFFINKYSLQIYIY